MKQIPRIGFALVSAHDSARMSYERMMHFHWPQWAIIPFLCLVVFSTAGAIYTSRIWED